LSQASKQASKASKQARRSLFDEKEKYQGSFF
jgi:hypothetical protein